MARILLLVSTLVAISGIACSTADADDKSDCANYKDAPGPAVVACGRLIKSGTFKGAELAGLYENLGSARAYKNDIDGAIEAYGQAVLADRTRVGSFFSRGYQWTRKGDYRRAISDYSEAIRLNPRHELALMRRADAYERLGELEQSIADYQAALAIIPNTSDYKAAIARLQQKLAARPDSAPAPRPAPAPPARVAAARPAPPPVAVPRPDPAAPAAPQVAALPQPSPPPSAIGTPNNDIGRRIALVIGNDRYANLSADRQLTNAINDARAVKATLEGLHFEVLYGENLDRRALVDRLFDLAARLGKDDIAFFYFAGHGVSFSGANYLLPSDIPTPHATGRAEEARLADQAIAETQVIERIIGSGARVAIVVLDACRDNPLRGTDTRSLGNSRGLSLGQPAQGVFSIYSAGFGQGALDRLGPDDRNPNSVFTRVFIEKLKTPGLDLKAVATETRRTVVELAQKIGQNQFPAYYDQISGDVYLAGQPAR
jgi:tetratricopeptide (TPR) repeat protein